MNFEKFSLHPQVAAGVKAAGYYCPTPIQSQAIPNVMKGRDLIGLAQTGTGKTAVYVLPILHRLLKGRRKTVRALIIVPTRELAEQIHKEITILGSKTGLQSTTVYGGVAIRPQIQRLKTTEIVVACPGRLLDHLQRGTVNLSDLEVLVLDEADQMLDMGFMPEIRRIIKHLPLSSRQNLLFSATMPKQIRCFADEILKDSIQVKVGHSAPAETVHHAFYPVARHLKTPLLLQLLGNLPMNAVLVFTRTKYRAQQLGKKLLKAGYPTTALQGNMSQSQRQKAMDGFKSGRYQVMVATDIAARGIDVANVSHVINYDMPATPENYIHRIGRTGRAERTGEAFTLVTDEDRQMVNALHRIISKPIAQCRLHAFNDCFHLAEPPRQAKNAAAVRQLENGGIKPPKSATKKRPWRIPKNRAH